MGQEFVECQETPFSISNKCRPCTTNSSSPPEWQEMEYFRIKQQVLTLNFLPLTTIRCQIILELLLLLWWPRQPAQQHGIMGIVTLVSRHQILAKLSSLILDLDL